MSHEVSEKLPYVPLKPLEIEQESCPLFCRISAIFFNVIALAAFGAVFGIVIALQGSITVLTPGVVGGVIGLALGVALSILHKKTSPSAKYRVQTLEQLEKTQTSPEVLAAIQKVKEVVKEERIAFEDKDALQSLVTCITGALVDARPDIKDVWRTFLQHLGGKEVNLDFSPEWKRLESNSV